MSDLPSDLAAQLAHLHGRIDEMARRLANRKRVGVVAAADYARGLYRVRLKDEGSDGRPYLSPWLRKREWAMGDFKVHAPLAVGEQVALTSESGDLSDGEIEASLPCDAHPRPHNQAAEMVIERGDTRILITGERVEITAKEIALNAAEVVRITAPKTVVAEELHVGGEGGPSVHRVGDVDSAKDRAQTGASKLFAK